MADYKIRKVKIIILFRVLYCEKGLISNQRVLIYGKIISNKEGISITPEYVIGSGLVEFEENIENILSRINKKLLDLLIYLSTITLVHFIYKTFFSEKNKLK